jgi:DNA-binding transcriptional regulator YiaG
MGIDVFAHGQRCESCKETLIGIEEMERLEHEAAAALVKRGIRSGTEFKLVRKLAHFKATEIAELLDVRPETVSRWEREETEIPRVAAFTLGELYEHPKKTREKLEAFAS